MGCFIRGSASVLEISLPPHPARSSAGRRTSATTQRWERLNEKSGSNIGGVQTVKPEWFSTTTSEPITTINYFSGTGNYNLAVVLIASPVNFCSATGHQYCKDPLGVGCVLRGNSGSAGTGTRSFRLADATLPNSQLNCVSILNTDEDYICAIRKLLVVFNCAADSAPIERSEVVNEDTAIRISHLQGGNWKRLAGDLEFIVDYFVQRLFCLHWN